MSRRAWLACTASSLLGARALAQATKPPRTRPSDQQAEDDVQARAQQAGLKPFRTSRTAHYLGIGDAPEAFREKALSICERLADDYLEHFHFKGFDDVKKPTSRLVVVMLAGPKSYEAFTGEQAQPGVGGHYDLESNRLVIFDNRLLDQANQAQAKEANLVSLVHEATHQLTYNTGLLERSSDVPVCVSEGLAMYAEVRSASGKSRLGQVNSGRLEGLLQAQRSGVAWLPLEKLLVDDRLFDGDGTQATVQLAYAESWLLVYTLMQTTELVPSFRRYLGAIRTRRNAEHRFQDARANLGDLAKLNERTKQWATKLSRGSLRF